MNKELEFTKKTPTEPGHYYVLTDQHPIKVEIIDAGAVIEGSEQDLVVRYRSGQDVAISSIPAEAQWHKRIKEEIERNEGRAAVVVFFNISCISCDFCNQGMIKVGPFVICHDCFQREFAGEIDSDELCRCYVNKDNPTYIKFVEKNKNKDRS